MQAAAASLDSAAWVSLRTHFDRISDLPPEESARYLSELGKLNPAMAGLLEDLLQTVSTHSLIRTPPAISGPFDPLAAKIRAFEVGQVINSRFEIEELLGEGGSGQVYRAFDRYRQIRIALKSLRPGLAEGTAAADSLRNELNIASQVSHPNICRLYDIALADQEDKSQVSFITMELLQGESLAARLRHGPIQVSQAYHLVSQLVEALRAAHASGIIHRDLKPANILLVPSGTGERAVITDFGLAQEICPDPGLSAQLSFDVAGTPAYMAPEQLEDKHLTRAVDVHALGAVMFEMVTGFLPFRGDTVLAVAAARLTGEAPSPRQFVPNLDRKWEHAIQSCLQRDPQKRPSIEQIVQLLRDPPPRRWPIRVAVGAATFGLLGAALVNLVGVRASHPPAARQAYQDGLIFEQRRSPSDLLGAIDKFKTATKIQPTWPEAWAHLAEAYLTASNFGAIETQIGLDNGGKAADQALRLNPRLPAARGVKALTEALDYSAWPLAQQDFQAAIDADPHNADFHRWYASYLRKLGRFRAAEKEARTAVDLSNRQDPRAWTELAMSLFTAGNMVKFYETALEQKTLFPTDAISQAMFARSLEFQGKLTEAAAALDFSERLGLARATILVDRASLETSRHNWKAASNYASELKALSLSKPIDGILLAGVYARLGQLDEAFAAIERAYRQKDNTLLSLATSPFVQELRTDPRYSLWLNKLNFSPQIMQQMELRSSSPTGSPRQPN